MPGKRIGSLLLGGKQEIVYVIIGLVHQKRSIIIHKVFVPRQLE